MLNKMVLCWDENFPYMHLEKFCGKENVCYRADLNRENGFYIRCFHDGKFTHETILNNGDFVIKHEGRNHLQVVSAQLIASKIDNLCEMLELKRSIEKQRCE